MSPHPRTIGLCDPSDLFSLQDPSIHPLFTDDLPQDREQLRRPQLLMEAESSLLGALMLDNETWEQVSSMLTDSDFYRHEHRLIFQTLATLISADKPADVVTVYEDLRARGKDQEMGGLGYLHQLSQYVPSAGIQVAVTHSIAS